MTEYLDKEVLDEGRRLYDERYAGNEPSQVALSEWLAEHADALLSAAEEVPKLRAALDQAVREREEARAAHAETVRTVAENRLEGYRSLGERLADSENQCDSLRAEVAGLRKDAERYRWLREKMDTDYDSGLGDMWVIFLDDPGVRLSTEEVFDAAIDSALAKRTDTGDAIEKPRNANPA